MNKYASPVLDVKEKLYTLKLELAQKYNTGVISIALNIPYPERKEGRYNVVYEAAVKELYKALGVCAVTVNESSILRSDAGKYLIISVKADLLFLKELCVAIENSHKWGRLFDIDVCDCKARPIKRNEIGCDKRRCIICNDYAVNCIVLKKHTKQDVLEQINRMLNQKVQTDSDFIARDISPGGVPI